jgi:cellulose synthase/poly-beta-1,6-N-acetylglucosamine synthase-like glycosyltransferase
VTLDVDLLVGFRPLLVVVNLWVLAMIALVAPMVRDHGDDQGDGMALVLLPRPELPRLSRTLAFVVVFVSLQVAYHSLRGPNSPQGLYREALGDVVSRVVVAPAQVDAYVANFDLGLRVLVLGAMLSLALTCRASPLRRVSIVVQSAWFVVAVFLFDCLLMIATVLTGLSVAPGTLLGNWFAVLIGFFAMARLVYANFALPKPTALRRSRRSRLEDAIVLVGTTVIGMCVSLTLLVLVYQASDEQYRPFMRLLAPLPFAWLAALVRSALLGAMSFVVLRRPAVGSDRPAIDVLIPAYNEEAVIVATLTSIDAAARHYGGPVRIIMTDDGSTDRTRPLAEQAIAGFAAATATIIDGPHGGKSAALNLALAETTADIVVRIDADTLISEDAFAYLPRWFRDPEVGMVEALMWPRWEPTPYHRLRMFEELKVFGLNHRVLQHVDAVSVVPGVFAAFRRAPAVAMGGFTVGMNGEDGDFTLRMGRLGWQTRLDPNIVVYEGVPESFMELREQRVRWCRASIHNQSRHGIYRAGVASSKVWFAQTLQFFRRVNSPIAFMLPAYLLVYAAFQGAWRTPVVAFLGAYFVAQVAFMVVQLFLAVGYGFGRRIAWVLLWPLWQYCLIMFSTESLLSLPGRPWHPLNRRRQVISEAVIH